MKQSKQNKLQVLCAPIFVIFFIVALPIFICTLFAWIGKQFDKLGGYFTSCQQRLARVKCVIPVVDLMNRVYGDLSDEEKEKQRLATIERIKNLHRHQYVDKDGKDIE
jgi:hypothetical protein